MQLFYCYLGGSWLAKIKLRPIGLTKDGNTFAALYYFGMEGSGNIYPASLFEDAVKVAAFIVLAD